MSELKQYCTFYLDHEMFGIEVLKVQEVMRKQEMTDVPLAPKVVAGLMNLRGSIVSCIDLRLRFGLSAADAQAEAINIVTQTSSGLVSFQVDRIGDVVEITEADFELPPPTLCGPARPLVDGVFKLNNALLQVVNVERVLELEGVHD